MTYAVRVPNVRKNSFILHLIYTYIGVLYIPIPNYTETKLNAPHIVYAS